MSLFNTKVTALSNRIDSLLAAMATIGFDPALLENDPQALAAHVSNLGAQEDAAVTASIEQLNTDLAATKTAHAAAQATATLFAGALSAAGVDLPADLSALTAETLRTALDAAISGKATAQAAAQVALSGHAPLNIPSGSEPVAKTSKELFAEFNAITDHQQRAEFWARHSARMLN